MSAAELRRELGPGETLVRCEKCGRIDIPLNDDELWHYVVTGEGLGKDCPKPRRVPSPCKWAKAS